MDPAVILVMPVRPLSLHNQRVRSRADVDVLGVEARQRSTCLMVDIFLFRFGIRCTGYLSLARNPVSHVGAIHTIALWNKLNRSGHSLRFADERSGKSYPPRETSEYPRMPLCSPYPRRCCLSGLWPLLSHIRAIPVPPLGGIRSYSPSRSIIRLLQSRQRSYTASLPIHTVIHWW